MSIEKARAALAAFGADTRIREFEVSSATVALAAEALGCEPARIAKTLSYKLSYTAYCTYFISSFSKIKPSIYLCRQRSLTSIIEKIIT